ncbi:MAG TPA: DUF192 domain-containing protein [Casimicrobiaceae bacterium]|nr:DUF192 domain-containing protein [Casimicrobiaceae bacterium]
MIGRTFALLAATAFAATVSAAQTVVELATVPLTINDNKLTAEVAKTPEQQMTGLMYRFSLKPDHGMVFVFDRSEQRAFWMKNTYIPLSIAFVAADGRIVNIEDMAPRDEASHFSAGPAMYAIEMRKGWFAERGIRAGDRVSGLPPPTRQPQ